MALSQEQKQFLNELSFNPEACLTQLQKNPDYVKKFKGQYLINGTSLLHVLVAGFLSDKQDIYEQLLDFVMTHSTMSFFDKKDNQKDSAFDIFEAHYSEYKREIGDMIEQQREIIFDEIFLSRYLKLGLLSQGRMTDYQYAKMASFLLLNKQYDKYKSFSSIDRFEHSRAYSLIQSLILTNDTTLLHDFLETHPQAKNSLTSLSVHYPGDPHNVSNLLTFAAYKNKTHAFEYLLNHFDFDLNGKITQQTGYGFSDIYVTNYRFKGHRAKRYTSPLNELVFAGNLSGYQAIMKKLNHETLFAQLRRRESFIGGKSSMSLSTGYTLLFEQQNSAFFETFYEKNQTINDVEFSIRKKYIEDLLSISLNDNCVRQIHRLFEQIDWHQFNQELIRASDFTEKFIFHVTQGNLNEYSLSLVKDIFSHLFSLEKINTTSLFQFNTLCYPEVVKTLLDVLPNHKVGNFYNDEFVPVNAFNYVLKNHTSRLNATPETNSKIKQSLTLLYEHNRHRLMEGFEQNENPLSYVLQHSLSEALSVLDNEDLIKFGMVKDDLFSILVSTNSTQDFYEMAVRKLLSLGANPFIEGGAKIFNAQYAAYPFFHWMRREISHDLLLDTVNRFNQNFYDLSQYEDFWQELIHNKDIIPFLAEHGADFNNALILKKLSAYNTQCIADYLKHSNLDLPYGMIHQMVKNKLYTAAIHTMQVRPELAIEQNEQKRFPGFYLISTLYGELKDRNFHEDIKPALNLLILNVELAAEQKKPKVIESFVQQLEKYPVIIEKIPELKPTIDYHLLMAKTKNQIIKRKMKI